MNERYYENKVIECGLPAKTIAEITSDISNKKFIKVKETSFLPELLWQIAKKPQIMDCSEEAFWCYFEFMLKKDVEEMKTKLVYDLHDLKYLDTTEWNLRSNLYKLLEEVFFVTKK